MWPISPHLQYHNSTSSFPPLHLVTQVFVFGPLSYLSHHILTPPPLSVGFHLRTSCLFISPHLRYHNSTSSSFCRVPQDSILRPFTYFSHHICSITTPPLSDESPKLLTPDLSLTSLTTSSVSQLHLLLSSCSLYLVPQGSVLWPFSYLSHHIFSITTPPLPFLLLSPSLTYLTTSLLHLLLFLSGSIFGPLAYLSHHICSIRTPPPLFILFPSDMSWQGKGTLTAADHVRQDST